MDEGLIREAEAALSRVHGVIDVAIDHSEDRIDAIHIVADEGRPPKQVVRDIVSSLRARLRIPVDHKKVSIARMRPEAHPAGAPAPADRGALRQRDERVSLRSIRVQESDVDREVEVVLRCSDREARGVAAGGAGTLRGSRLMALATVRALERFLHPRYRLDIEEVRSVSLASREVVLVSASMVDDRQEQVLLGSGWVIDDPRRAVVLATLDALNRIFGRLERRRHVEYEVGPTSPSSGPPDAAPTGSGSGRSMHGSKV